MPNTFFYSFLQSIIRFFQWIFVGITRLLAPVYALSPLPDTLDFILVCLIIVGIIFAIFQSSPWNR
jgi:hypothetical protein